MKFEIPFDEVVLKEQQKLHFDSVWLKTNKKRNENLIFGIGLLIVGIAIVIGSDNVGFLFIAMSLFMLNYSYRMNNHYKTSKKAWDDLFNLQVEQQVGKKNVSEWEVNDDFFHYTDYKLNLKMDWLALTGYRKINETIFVDTNVGICLVLSQKEIGVARFDEFLELLNRKLNQTSS